MKKIVIISLFVLIALVAFAGNTKTTTTFGSPASNQPQALREFEYEVRTKFNKAVNDIDTVFNHLGGLTSDSIGKTTGNFTNSTITTGTITTGTITTGTITTGTVTTLTSTVGTIDSAYIKDLTVDTLYADTAYIPELVSDSAAISAWLSADSIDVRGVDADVIYCDSAYIPELVSDSATISTLLDVDGICQVDSFIVDVEVETEEILAADSYIWLNVNGTRYKLMLKAE